MITNENATPVIGVRKEITKSAVSLSRIYKADYQKEGTKTAEIRQTVTTKSHYPSKKTESNLQNGLFETEEFGFATKDFDSVENRVAWVLVPESKTDDEVKGSIALGVTKGSCIYKVLSSTPILDENQNYAIAQRLRNLDFFANSQVIRYPQGVKDAATGADISNKLILDINGNPQYRRTFYWSTPMEDKDLRNSEDVYISPEIAVEMEGASVLTGQRL